MSQTQESLVRAGLAGSELPLIATALVLLAVGLLPRLGHTRPLWLRSLVSLAVFACLTALAQRVIGSPLHPHLAPPEAGPHATPLLWAQLAETGWWLVAARVAIGLARLVVVLEDRPRETRLVSDLLAGAISLAALLAVISLAFEVPIRGLVATSGVIAIVLGLALQSTLSDLFSGIAVGLERAYRPGDVLRVEGGVEGRVVQVNWRSTRIALDHDAIAIVPNSIIAKTRLVNLSAPTPARGDAVILALDPAADPAACIAALTAAAWASACLQSDPPPTVALTGLKGDGAAYEVGFSVASGHALETARTELLAEVHRHLRHAGIALAVAGTAVLPACEPVGLPDMLAASEVFRTLPPDERTALAKRFRTTDLAAGGTLCNEGETIEALHLVASGTLGIYCGDAAGSHLIARLGPGRSFGAIGLMTAAPYRVTARALTPVATFRLDKADLATAIRECPALVPGLEALAARGRAILEADTALHEDRSLDEPGLFLGRLRNALRVLSS